MEEFNEKEREVLLSFASRVDRNDPGALNNLGVVYFRKEMYGESMAQFKEALKIDPRFDLARENLWYLFAETNMEDPDVSTWKKEVEKDPENVEALLRLGVSYQNMGRFREASDVLGGVVEHQPDHFLARMHLGSVLKAQGLYQQALEHYGYVRDDAGKSAVFHSDLGEIYYNLGRTEEAVSELRTAIKYDVDYWRSHFLLSFAYGDNGNLQEALEESRVASRLNPSFHNTEANLALSDYGKSRMDEMCGGTGKEIPSLESTSFTLGTAYRERGFPKEALKEFAKALQEMPDKDRVYIEIGKIHLSEKNEGKALSVFLKALELNPENAEVYRLLGCVYHLRDDINQAATCYLQAYRLNSADANAMNNLGVLLYQVGLLEDAERMFKKGLNLKLYHMELNYNFLTCIILKEEYLMAENLVQRLEAFMGKSAILYEKRAMLNYKLNRLTLALFDIESALALDCNHSDALYLKGLIFLREEDFRGAIKAISGALEISQRYTGLSLFLAIDDRIGSRPVMVDPSRPFNPGDDLIELLQSGINRRFDKMRDLLVAVVENGVSRVRENDSGSTGEVEVEAKCDSGGEQETLDALEELRQEL